MNNQNFFDLTEIEITLTYPFLDQKEPMKFFLRPILSSEEKQARQTFFGLTDAEQETKRHEYNVNLLAGLSVKLPENIPSFENRRPLADDEHLGYAISDNELIKNFFAGSNPMKIKVLEDALNLYFQKMQPQEFFR